MFGLVAQQGWQVWVVVGLQVLCAVHVLRTRNQLLWLWLILFVPLVGCLLYLLVHRRSLVTGLGLRLTIPVPLADAFDLRAAQRALRLADTLDNRVAVANCLIDRGRADEALATLAPAHQGAQKHNIILLIATARAHFARGDHAEAARILLAAEAVPNNERLRQRRLLLAICHERLGDLDEAERRYQEAQGGFVGEEARARYAGFLAARGRVDEAKALYRRILDSVAVSNWTYRRQQRTWGALAKAELKRLEAPPPDRRAA